MKRRFGVTCSFCWLIRPLPFWLHLWARKWVRPEHNTALAKVLGRSCWVVRLFSRFILQSRPVSRKQTFITLPARKLSGRLARTNMKVGEVCGHRRALRSRDSYLSKLGWREWCTRIFNADFVADWHSEIALSLDIIVSFYQFYVSYGVSSIAFSLNWYETASIIMEFLRNVKN